ncbi:hypothetical protein CRUP_016456 [Coryphaenoides rupestris]|nr:hypothetical protein CRUP_016456 [Coryphaenoides rupestris]
MSGVEAFFSLALLTESVSVVCGSLPLASSSCSSSSWPPVTPAVDVSSGRSFLDSSARWLMSLALLLASSSFLSTAATCSGVILDRFSSRNILVLQMTSFRAPASALQGLSLGSQRLGLLPDCSLSGAQQLEDVLALSRAQELGVLRDKGLDVERHGVPPVVLRVGVQTNTQALYHLLEHRRILAFRNVLQDLEQFGLEAPDVTWPGHFKCLTEFFGPAVQVSRFMSMCTEIDLVAPFYKMVRGTALKAVMGCVFGVYMNPFGTAFDMCYLSLLEDGNIKPFYICSFILWVESLEEKLRELEILIKTENKHKDEHTSPKESLYEPLTNPKRFHDPCTGQKAHYGELLSTCVYDVDDSVYPSSVSRRASIQRISHQCPLGGTEMSAYAAYKGEHINKRTYLFLSRQGAEWVEEASVDANGSVRHIITDGKSGRRLCIETAISQRFLETTELASYRSGSLSIYELVDLIYSRMVVVEDVNSPVAGLWDSTQRKLLSVLQAFQENLIDGVTALRLLEAQVCTGGILDPTSGEKATLKQALSRGLVGGSFARQLSLYEQAYHGIVQPKTGKRISVAQAIQENLFPKDIGMRCLEFQLLTGGLINPETQSRISLEEVAQSGLLDKSSLALLKDAKFYSKILICPKTRRCISYKEALETSIHDHHTGLRLLEAVRAKATRQSYWNYH